MTPTPRFTRAIGAGNDASSTPLDRILRAYDRAAAACETFDQARARTAIALLRQALALDSSASRSFDALFAWCEDAVDAHDYIGPARTLRTLRDAWCKAAGRPTTAFRPRDPLVPLS
jgi:hypothetical protein